MKLKSETSNSSWSEKESELFIERGRMYTPRQEEILESFLELIPFEQNDQFAGVELGTGTGWLTAGILKHFPNANMVGFDGSETMRNATTQTLAAFPGRAEIRRFRLEDQSWLTELPSPLLLVVSSLVIHHLEGDGKQELFAQLFERLSPGGALLILDVVLPANQAGRKHMAQAWNAEVKSNSLKTHGNLSSYEQFVSDEWNIYQFPDPTDLIDHPSTLVDQLGWLRAAGFDGVDAWWVRGGHALFGGYKPD